MAVRRASRGNTKARNMPCNTSLFSAIARRYLKWPKSNTADYARGSDCHGNIACGSVSREEIGRGLC
ncbi:hypothetical protein TGPRC2_200375 [Toxoplasma gondii TgCatPRC2]|uniref:Uncharacterized protein n=3 Tax=Toxoplasma gondii TaxID=5811 RepID=A0A151GZT7_TOXGO|nr:hypothetical protein TGME49_200375 [Toxoplasma gondii ME49]EPT28190.1 hypothetical protein TGME49_200375 [Toxoplasma gondii ME49]KYF38635.1 hypothetical protein TGARI_200375 [Toxoplasma gondii ARI]KYK62597.1 hypothetical protein TGPRC2_200375 [Toxoplasma gondii TgCatPRC2]|eukprot:XP_018636522.1 hypothetical protein TGME49_200375 [Toxoplasma gondii ME49]